MQIKLLYAPWTDEQVKKLEERQANEMMHPYNCICGEELIPTNDGWICPVCGYQQKWCHKVDAL